MVKRFKLGVYSGQAAFRISPPGLDVDTISSEQCLLSETWAADFQVIQSGVVVYTGQAVPVPVPEFDELPIPLFYAVANQGEAWRLPNVIDRDNNYATDVTLTPSFFQVRNQTPNVNVVYLLCRRTRP